MEIRVMDKTYKIPWEYIIAPFIILLTIITLIITNSASIKKTAIDYSDKSISIEAPQVIQASPGSSLTDVQGSTGPGEEQEKPSESIAQNQSNQFGKVNINKAGMDELMSLPYIGEVKAKAIIDYRSVQGPFKSIDELESIKGIGPKTLEKLRPIVTIE